MNPVMKKLLAAVTVAGVLGAGVVAAPGVVFAQESETPTIDPAAEQGEVLSAQLDECDLLFEEVFESELEFDLDEGFLAEDLAEMNSDTQKLVDALTSAGIEVTTSDDDGYLNFEIGEITEEQEVALQAIFEDVWGPFGADLTDSEIAEMNSEENELAAHLDGAGVSYEKTTDELGLVYVEIDWEDEAAVAAYDAYWDQAFDDYSDYSFLGIDAETQTRLQECDQAYEDAFDLWDEDFGSSPDFLLELTAEEIAEINAEEDALATHLDGLGVSYEVIEDEFGFHYVEIDWEDDAAVDAFDSYWENIYGELEDFDLEGFGPEDFDLEDFDLEEFDIEEFDLEDLDSDGELPDHEMEDDDSDS